MSKVRKGNKQNALLNEYWGKHVRKSGKRMTAGIRRMASKLITSREVQEVKQNCDYYDYTDTELMDYEMELNNY